MESFYACPLCDEWNMYGDKQKIILQNYRQHLIVKHSLPEYFDCNAPNCTFYTSETTELIRHYVENHRFWRVCIFCSKSFRKIKGDADLSLTLEKHSKECEYSPLYYCYSKDKYLPLYSCNQCHQKCLNKNNTDVPFTEDDFPPLI